jgi:uncharacterized membrane protein
MSEPETRTTVAPVESFDDNRMELIMGRLLQVGVLLASTVVLIGGALYLYRYAVSPTDLHRFSGGAVFPTTGVLLRGMVHGDPAAIIQIGILLLIATPIARVIFATIAFAIERDRMYIAISLVILVVLLVGFFHSR